MSNEFDVVKEIFEGEKLTFDEYEQLFMSLSEAMQEEYEWLGSEPFTIVLGDKKYDLRMKGRRQFEFLRRLSVFLNENLSGIFEGFQEGESVTNIKAMSTLIDPEIFAELGCVLLGEEREFVEEHFDIDWIIAAAEMVYNSNRKVKSLIKGFFTKKD